MTFSHKKVGGLRFLRIGRLSLSFCVVRKQVSTARTMEPSPARLRSVASVNGRIFIIA